MNQPKLQRHSKYGYWYYPVNQSDLDGYYANSYIDPLAKPDDPIELRWKRETLWSDIAEVAIQNRGAVLDIGSGDGAFAKYLKSLGIDVMTVDKNGNADYRDLEDINWDIGEGINYSLTRTATVLNTLEHIADPRFMLRQVSSDSMIRGAGVKHIVVRVPNDFNKLQSVVAQTHDQYWLHYPEHVNYFDIPSLTALLEDTGWRVIKTQCDYPMELFILSGWDYLDDPSFGRASHKMRRELELALPPDVRREMWVKFAEMGIGRNIIVYAERK